MKKAISLLDKIMGTIEYVVLFASMVIMLVVTVIEVIDIKFLHLNLMWTSEVLRIMLVWCILSGASVAAGKRQHLGVTFFVEKMPKKVAKYVILLTDLVSIFVCIYVIISGIALVKMQIKLGTVFSITRWPTVVAEIAIPICFTFVTLRILFTVYSDFFGEKKEGEEAEA